MKFAIVNGERQEPQPNLVGECPGCEKPVVAKCGELRVWHWAHKGRRLCDPWWENETEWHRAWKNRFPTEWQEIVHRADDGERHIADVKTEQGYVIEFQHSPIKLDERQAREDFYKKMLWIVDGTRRSTDKEKFLRAFDRAARFYGREDFRVLPEDSGNPLLRDWSANKVSVVFDFGEDMFWGLLPKRADGKVYVFRMNRCVFVACLRSTQQSDLSFDKLLGYYIAPLMELELHLQKLQKSQANYLFAVKPMRRSRRRL